MKAPTIIIGVGGVGSQVCAKVEEQLLRTSNRNGDGSSMGSTRFIAIDTDINSLRELHRHGFQGKRVLLTDNMTVAKCRDAINDPAIGKWYPENSIFSKKSMTEGAGQQRSISRLAFEYAIRDGRLDELGNTIRDLNLLAKKDSCQRTRFYILSSLAGGTGSGIILPLALYINDLILKMYGDHLAVCKGFFILSSVFYTRNRMSALERRSLDANAYAAVKELSSFMRAADDGGSRMEAGRGGPLFERGRGSYEYCYLFGLTNERNKDIRSLEELKGVVADAVYMQACSPMQDKNNSREDNTLRHIDMLGGTNGEKWLRRFGGIGCGRLIYPYEDLVRCLGLLWARDTMGATWIQYDEEYLKKRRGGKERPFCVENAAELDQGEEYVKAVDNAGPSDRMADYIRKECLEPGSGKPRWELYLEALSAEARREIADFWQRYTQSSGWESFFTKLQDLTNRVSSKNAGANRYQTAQQAANLWDDIWEKSIETLDPICASVCGGLFRQHRWDPGQGRSGLRECWMEYWLVSATGEFLHPNSIRYFLYHLRSAAAQRRKPPVSIVKPNSPFVQKKRAKMRAGKGDELRRKFEAQEQQLSGLMADRLWERVLDRCESYVKKLIDCYEDFYSGYQMILAEFDTDIKTIGEKLDCKDGVIHYYVCADKTCREKLHDELRFRRGYEVGAVSGVSLELFRMVNESGLESGRMATRECANRIKDFWSAGVKRKDFGGELLDMNILRAMNKEAEFKTGRALSEKDFEEEIYRVEDSLAAPFLQFFQRLDRNTGVSLSCFHSSLGDEIGVFQYMVKWLRDHGAVDDPSYCTKRELLFYRSFVGLEVYEVLDYLHGISALTAVEGHAFQSYQAMLRDMGKNGREAGRLRTPHIHTKWHNLYYMEDPSGQHQREQELLIAIALLFSCLNDRVRESGGERKYIFTPEREIGADSDSLDDVAFDTLHEFHLLLYGNIYWYMELCWDMHRVIQEAFSQKKDAYETIKKEGAGWTPFDLIILYQNEMLYGKRTVKQRELLADAGVCIVYACTKKSRTRSRERECIQETINRLERTLEIIKSGEVCGLSLVSAGIDPNLQNELKNFIEGYILNLRNMEDEQFRQRYGTVMGDFFFRGLNETD